MPVPAERLREGQQILVRGKTSFSRIASVIDGPALERRVAQELKRGSLYPTKVPHTTISIIDAQVLPLDPTAPTQEETFVFEKTFELKTGENAGRRGFNVDNKSTTLPTVLEMDPDVAGSYRQLVLERDLASGLDVTLVLEVYKPKGYEKRGLALRQVVLHEPVRYYASSGVDTSALAARGIVVNGPIRTVSASESPAAVSPEDAAATFQEEAARTGFAVPANTGVSAEGLPVPTPGAIGSAPMSAPAAQMFPQSAPVTQAPAPVAAPAAPAVAGAFPGETPEQAIARLQQQLAESQNAQAASGGASAFDAPAPAAVGGLTPWDVPGAGPAAFQG